MCDTSVQVLHTAVGAAQVANDLGGIGFTSVQGR
eukprot:COSAG05_NODE_74_length_21769_cov_194.316290_25_plen_34_part_00